MSQFYRPEDLTEFKQDFDLELQRQYGLTLADTEMEDPEIEAYMTEPVYMAVDTYAAWQGLAPKTEHGGYF